MSLLTEDIRTERLLLRRPTLDDAPRMAEVANDIRIARNMTSLFPHPYDLAAAEAWIPVSDGLAIFTTDAVGDLSPGMVGMVGAHVGEGENADVVTFGYWLAVGAWGHGFATEASRAFLDRLVETVPVRRVEAMVYGWNPASGRVLEKLGFVLEGRLKNRVRRFGELTDELVYGWVSDQS